MSKQEILVLQKEVFLTGEREKRKDQLLELQKSKQERTDSELQHLRQICERQQRDISYMQMHLQSSQDAFLKAETETRDERDFESGAAHPEWLNMAAENIGPLNSSLGSRTRPLDTSSHVVGLSTVSQETPGNNIVHEFTALSVGGMEYGLNGPLPYSSDPKPLTVSTERESPLSRQFNPGSTSDSEQFFQLPSVSRAAPPPHPNYLLKTGMAAQNLNTDNSSITPQHQDDEGSPTSKLHRLLAESRQMVQNLEQTTIKTPPGGLPDGSSKFSPSSQSTTSPNTGRPKSS